MVARPRRGVRAPNAAASDLGDQAADDSSADSDPQAFRRLTERVARRRHLQVERLDVLRVAYGALRRADELAPACDLRRAATVALGHLAETRGDLARLREFERFAGLER